MDWILDDWEYPNDEIYAIERQKDIEAAMYQWEEEQMSKNRLPAIIKIETPILLDEAECNTTTVRRAHQKRL
jgi:hypothetical protein